MEQKISKNMTFGELLRIFPGAAPILGQYGLHCIGCHLSVSETIEQGMRAHGMDDARITQLIEQLNKASVN
ncbi:MAG TPA: DUF1858 domain-containing protein [Spirochaetota bacterium]|nr:DUF1858 domain-containing protein [Spirochaetota bacterium]